MVLIHLSALTIGPVPAHPVVLMSIVALAWSGGWIAGKVGVTAIPPLALSSIRFIVAGLILLALARIAGSEVPWRRWRALLALGATGVLGYNALVFVGLVAAPASDGGLIVPTLAPVLAAALAAPFAGEPLTREKILGLAASTAGVGLIVLGGAGIAPGSEARLVGDALLVGGAFCWAVYTVVGKSVLHDGSPLGITAAASFTGGLMLLPLAYIEGGLASIGDWPVRAWLAIGYLVVFATIVGFVLFYTVVERLGASRGAMTTYLVPVGTLVLAATLLGERVAPVQLLGGAMTLAGMRIATVPRGEEAWFRRFVGV
jgi:drug/metabolite transporter (DMT)-like permease